MLSLYAYTEIEIFSSFLLFSNCRQQLLRTAMDASIKLYIGFFLLQMFFLPPSISSKLLTRKQSLGNPSGFPSNFLLGTASSAYQYEGGYMSDGKGLNNWDVYSHKPGNIIVDGSNGDVAVDHYHQYLGDVDLMHSLGVNSYRFSISWSRILPQGRFREVNVAGINFYNNLIDALLLKGIKPFVTLTHFDFPQELEDRYGSWLSPQSQEDFAYFADICFKSFGDRVKYWVTFNEPDFQVTFGYRTGKFPPSRCSWPFGNCTYGDSEKEPFIAAHNIILAHTAAVHIYRTKYQMQGGSIGIVLHCSWYEPISNSIADKLAAERALSFSINWFLDPIIFGRYPPEMQSIIGSILPEFSTTEKEKLKKGLDFIGINHYASYYVHDCMFSVCEPGSGTSKTEGFWAKSLEKNGTPLGELTELDWLNVYPQGMEKIVTYIKERYNNIPMIITENGYGDVNKADSTTEELLHDVKRVQYIAGHLNALSTAIRKEADVRGYFAWSLLDNFEWNFGYTVRFGLYHVDYKTLTRRPKLSATWYKKFISEHGKVKDQRAEHAQNHPYYN
ncbi:beta-glucosidase 46-like isoform X2 [Durio zibethinus]|uniref:Beta-glucosidase 46-like isoform X2 n=1 Tax=Durio zibethinus TaxID=66656 RepID=A0A6P5WJE9_DURZI|nr:beta-glucosidase 46-like isoform X2 [Durio zibethinus]